MNNRPKNYQETLAFIKAGTLGYNHYPTAIWHLNAEIARLSKLAKTCSSADYEGIMQEIDVIKGIKNTVKL